jgi:cytochrome c oxidase assembly protein subunit 15
VLVVMFLVVSSGAFVRLTASGLGCDHWPRCGAAPFPTQGNHHAIIEFSNRFIASIGVALTLFATLASRKVPGLSRAGRLSVLLAFLGAAAQIPLGGITIMLKLNPLAVMAHFLLGLLVLGLAVVAATEAWSLTAGRAPAVDPPWLRHVIAWLGVPAAAALVVTGAVATASGPHPGAQKGVKRLGVPIVDTVYVHVRAAAVFGVGFLLLGWFLLRLRARYPGLARVWVAMLVVLVGQMVLGEVQYRSALPWGLVLLHVCLAATLWALALFIAYALWRPPAPLAAAVVSRPVGAPIARVVER